jgi:hypothetical protein
MKEGPVFFRFHRAQREKCDWMPSSLYQGRER